MTNEELVVQIQSGHTEYLPQLWDQVEKFVKMRAGKYLYLLGDNLTVEFDELYDSGYLALLSAVKGFSPDKGFSFLTYFEYALKTYFRRIAGIKKSDSIRIAVSLSTPLTEDEDCTIEDTLADDTDIVEEVTKKIRGKELHKALEAALSTLEPHEERIIRMRYYSNMPILDISKKLNIPVDRVQYHIRKAMNQLRSPDISKSLIGFCR